MRSSAREALWACLLPVIILGGIFGGVVTATEGAALAVVAALFVGLLIYRELDVRHLRLALVEGAVQTAVVMLLVAFSALLGTYLTEVQAPQALARSVSEMTNNKWDVPAGPVHSVGKALTHPQTLARGMVIDLVHPQAAATKALGCPIHFSATPTRVDRPAPMLGEHSRELLREFGYDKTQIEGFIAEGAVESVPEASGLRPPL